MFQAADIAAWLRQLDPTCPIDHASGWFDQLPETSAVCMSTSSLPRFGLSGRAAIVSSLAAAGAEAHDHVWDPAVQSAPDEATRLLRKGFQLLIASWLSAAVYTQTTDVEIEINGYCDPRPS
jgi:hypothetical protein